MNDRAAHPTDSPEQPTGNPAEAALAATGGSAPASPDGASESDLATIVAEYWTGHNVTMHRVFGSREESLEFIRWRNDQYPGYIELMPVSGVNGLDVLDYGCGPGHDVIGFVESSKPRSLVGVDVSPTSLAELQHRLNLHGGEQTKLILANPDTTRLRLPSASFDYIHCSGVLHHIPDLPGTLRELRRLLRPDGSMRVMVYNYDSLWVHLYVAWQMQLRDGIIPADLPIRAAFTRATDGPDCPISNCYTPDEFGAIAAEAGFDCTPVGVSMSLHEMEVANVGLYQACMDRRLPRAHREFLLELTRDERGWYFYRGVPAGINLVLELRHT
jgi:SAM-dependent methyltransferase